jgi:hypothetical protein
MFCTNGHENAADAKFCRSCGQALNGGANQANSAPSSAQTSPKKAINIQSLKSDLMDDLQRQRHASPPVDLQSVITMISGALFAFAVLLLAFDAIDSSDSDSPFMIGFVWTAIGCAAAYLSIRFISKDLISGATVATIPLLALSVLFLFGNTIDDGNIGFPMVVLGVAYGAAWALPILRARPALLSSGLLSAGFGIVILIMQSSISGYSVFDSPTDLLNSVAQQSSSLLLIAGIVLLAFAWRLDRKDWPSLGRIFIGVGIVFEGTGAFGVLGSSGDRTAASLLLAVAGVLLIAVAVQRSRKTSLLIGGFGGFAGIVAFISAITQNSDGFGPTIALMLIASAGLGFVAIKKSALIQSKLQGIGKP